jgi:hypothetical protein
MPSPDEYRLRAQRCLEMAQTATDPETARLLRILAADYFELAESQQPSAQQQQQIQPKDSDENDS